jgi:hypothetical protein
MLARIVTSQPDVRRKKTLIIFHITNSSYNRNSKKQDHSYSNLIHQHPAIPFIIYLERAIIHFSIFPRLKAKKGAEVRGGTPTSNSLGEGHCRKRRKDVGKKKNE